MMAGGGVKPHIKNYKKPYTGPKKEAVGQVAPPSESKVFSEKNEVKQ